MNGRLLGETVMIKSILAFSLVCACATTAPQRFDSAAEGEKLLRRDAEWSNLATEGKDVDRIVSYWTDDALLVFNGQPYIEGKAAIRAFVASSLATPGFRIHWVSEKPVFSRDGTMAYMRGTDEMMVPGPGGAPMALHLHGVSVWRRDADGEWRCAIDASSEQPQQR
jgi:ketosteroid isomerase-like protein